MSETPRSPEGAEDPTPPAASASGAPAVSAAVGAAGADGVIGQRRPVPFTQQLGRVTVIVLAALFGVFAVTNSQRVAFSWVFGRTEPVAGAAGSGGGVPLILLLLASFAIGALTGALVVRRGVRDR